MNAKELCLSERKDRTEYTGKLKDFQQLGNQLKGKRYAEFERDPFNSYQNLLYKRALYGLKIYKADELATMHSQKKERITKVNQRTQRSLNIYKQEITNDLTNNIFKSLFPTSPITKVLVEKFNQTDSKFINKLSLKDLGISKTDIINRLVSEGILPKNFYELKPIENAQGKNM